MAGRLALLALMGGIWPLGAAAESGARAAALAAWDRVAAVVAHPRCTNCHVKDDRPGWAGLGYGSGALHGMYIRAGESRIGAESQPCRSCHVTSARPNLRPRAAPQIADAWRLPPPEQGWAGQSAAALCQQLRAVQAQEGALADHVARSAFVAWGFDPGGGRSAPPGSPAQLARDLALWSAGGTPCRD